MGWNYSALSNLNGDLIKLPLNKDKDYEISYYIP